jgi:tetratricopeptide (TPR) repeat protein
VLRRLSARIWLPVGDLFLALKQYGAAVQCFRWAARSDPDSETIQQRLAFSLWNAGAVEAAELAFGRLLEASPLHAGASTDFAMLLQEQNRHAEALAVLDKAITFKGMDKDPRLHTGRGISLVALGRSDEAIASFRNAVALDGSFVDAVIQLGTALAKAHRWEQAVRWLREAIQFRRDAPSAYNLGLALSKLDQPAEAEAAFRKAIAFETRPTELTAQASASLALAIGQQGRGEEALECAEQTLRSHPDDLSVLNTLSAVLIAEGQNERVLTLARESVRLYPDDARPYLSLGWGLLRSGEAAQALAAFNRAAMLASADVSDVQAGRGAALSALGRHREALEVFEQLLERDPHYLERDLAGEYYRASQEQVRGHPE